MWLTSFPSLAADLSYLSTQCWDHEESPPGGSREQPGQEVLMSTMTILAGPQETSRESYCKSKHTTHILKAWHTESVARNLQLLVGPRVDKSCGSRSVGGSQDFPGYGSNSL